ncbi:MAG TPA: AAA family ATPase, partial [Magnetococcales bacterium]|nr:AAA family ATPase [Magnetococcales bacterium]
MEVAIRPVQLGKRVPPIQPKRSQPFFPVASHAPVWRVLRSSIVRGEGAILITGAQGAGKSLFLQRLQGILPENRDMALFAEPDDSTIRFLEMLIRAVDPEWESLAPDGIPVSEDLMEALERRVRSGRKLLIAIDQAHLLTPENASLLELSIRFVSHEVHPLQVLLCGSHELIPLLDSQPFIPLGRLVIGSGEVTALTRSEVWDYIHFHLKKNWGDHYRVSWFAWVEIFSRSQGNPGIINEILNQIAAELKIRPQRIISRRLVCRAIDEKPEGGDFRPSSMLTWFMAAGLLILIGWSAAHFISVYFSKNPDAVRQITESVNLEDVLKKALPPKKESPPPSEEKSASAKTPPPGTSSRVLYSPVSPPDAQKKTNLQEEPWVPRERRNVAEVKQPANPPPQIEVPAPKEKKGVEGQPSADTLSARVPLPPSAPSEKLVVASHPAIDPPGQTGPQPSNEKARISDQRPVSPPDPVGKEPVSEAEKKSQVPFPRVHSPAMPPAAKQSTDKLPIPAEEVSIPSTHSRSTDGVPAVPVPKPFAVADRSTRKVTHADPLGQSMATIMEGNIENSSAPLPVPTEAAASPEFSGQQLRSNLMATPEPLKKHIKPVGSQEKGIDAKVSSGKTPMDSGDALGIQNALPLVSEKNLRSAGQLFVVQTGSFLNRENAERLAAVMAEKGLDPYVHLLV